PHLGPVGRGRRRGRQVLAVCADRVYDGLARPPDAITTVWSRAITQTCIVHLLRNSFRYAGRQHWDPIAKALRPVYTVSTEAAAEERFGEFAAVWALSTRQSCGCGRTPGPSSCRSWPLTLRSAGLSAPPAPSSPHD